LIPSAGPAREFRPAKQLAFVIVFLPFTWGRHRCARATTALPRATSLELLILFAISQAGREGRQKEQIENKICAAHGYSEEQNPCRLSKEKEITFERLASAQISACSASVIITFASF
jgi:hypothetical protein